MSALELKPCPFCGGDAVETRPSDVHCKDVMCAGYKTRHMSASQWNTRAYICGPTQDERVKALEAENARLRDHARRVLAQKEQQFARAEAAEVERDALRAELEEVVGVAARLADWAALDSAPDHSDWNAAIEAAADKAYLQADIDARPQALSEAIRALKKGQTNDTE